ncbi:hypothetical protein T03_7235 [Trichinella britovi]|uniref:Uncharacterized protein n=1 Tax=Trichinella britovi TaxID=45882 RepID=A0A0V0ZQ50_TRIBR|nr:hypothetical protein T03_7235 [Trichinella britovi]
MYRLWKENANTAKQLSSAPKAEKHKSKEMQNLLPHFHTIPSSEVFEILL